MAMMMIRPRNVSLDMYSLSELEKVWMWIVIANWIESDWQVETHHVAEELVNYPFSTQGGTKRKFKKPHPPPHSSHKLYSLVSPLLSLFLLNSDLETLPFLTVLSSLRASSSSTPSPLLKPCPFIKLTPRLTYLHTETTWHPPHPHNNNNKHHHP
jgi:hypothetical protein